MEKYRIKEVVLEKITSHEYTVLKEIPRYGSLALIGPNGAGKSSLIEAIYTALTLKPLRNNLVRYGAARGEIRVVLESDSHTVESKVTFYSTGGRKSKDVRLKENNKIVASTPSEYPKEIARILNITDSKKLDELLSSTTIIPQGKLREIADGMDKPKEFKALIENATGLPDYKKAVEQIKEVRLNVEDYYFQLPTISSKDPSAAFKGHRYQELSKSIENKSIELSELKRIKELKSREIKEYEEQLKTLDKDISMLKNKINNLRERRSQIQNEITRLNENIRVLEGKKRELESARRALIEAREASNLIPKLEEVSRLSSDVDRLRELDKMRVEKKAELVKLESILNDLGELAENQGKYEEYTRLLEESEKLTEEYRRLTALRSRLEAQFEELKRTREKAETLIKNTVKSLGATYTGDLTVDYENITRAFDSLIAERDKLKMEAENLNREENITNDKIMEASEVLDTLKRTIQPKCPVCGRDLDEEHKRSLIIKLEGELKELTSQLSSIQTKKRVVNEKLKELESKTEAAKKNIEKLLNYLESLKENDFTGKKAELDSVVKNYEAVQRRLTEVKNRLKDLEASADKYKRAYNNLLKIGVKPGDYEKYKAQHAEATRSLNELNAEIEGLKERILSATGKDILEEAIEEIESARDQVAALKAKASMLGDLEARVKELEEEIRSIDKLTRDVEAHRAELNALDKELKSLEVMLEEGEAKRSDLKYKMGVLEAEIAHHYKEIERLESELRKLREARNKMITGIMAGTIILDTQEKILENARRALEAAMSDILGKFKLDYYAVTIDEVENGFELKVLHRNNVGAEEGVPVSQLSGGEKTALSLAFVIALQRLLALKLGFLILDEPTSELDADRRSILMDLIQSLSSEGIVDQLIVITHHEDVVDKVDKTCKVVKNEGVSRLECLQEGAF